VEIGPISGIRPVAMVKPAERSADLAGVFAVELRRQGEDESYAPSQQAKRGLEEEDAEDGVGRDERAEVGGTGDRTISFFA